MSISESTNSIQVNGTPLTTSISQANSTLLTNEVDSRIAKIRPMATPIDQLSRCGDIRHAGSMKVNFYTADVKDVQTTLTRDFRVSDYKTSSSGGNGGQITLPTANGAIFSATETVMVPAITIDGQPLTVYVTDIDGDDVNGYIVNSIYDFQTQVVGNLVGAQNAVVVRMGRAAGELDVQSPQYETLPKRSENFCQIFKMQVEESTLHRLSNKEAQWGFSDQEEAAIIDMRQGMEKNFLFGLKNRMVNDSTGDEIYLTGGIWNQEGLDTFAIKREEFDESKLIEMCRVAFTGGKGSARKVLMAGSEFIEMLSNLEVRHIVVGQSSTVRWGLEFREIKSNFGTLYVIHNEIFDQCSHSADAMIIDVNMLTKYVHIPMQTEKLNLRSAGTRNTDAVVITEASCLVLRNPKCHLRVVTSTPFDEV